MSQRRRLDTLTIWNTEKDNVAKLCTHLQRVMITMSNTAKVAPRKFAVVRNSKQGKVALRVAPETQFSVTWG